MTNSDPCEIVTVKNIILELSTRDCVDEITPHTDIGFSQFSGASLQIGELNPFVTFYYFRLSLPFSRSCVEVEQLDRFSRYMAQTMCFCARSVFGD